MQHNHIHSIRWPFTHPFACRHIHIQLTIHSYDRYMLSYHYICLLSSRFWHHQYTSAWRGGDLRLDEGYRFWVESHQCMSGEGQRAFQWQSAFVSDWSNNDTNTSHTLLSDQSNNNDTNTSHTFLSDWSNNNTNASHTLLSDWSNNGTNTSHTLLTGQTMIPIHLTYFCLTGQTMTPIHLTHFCLTGLIMTPIHLTHLLWQKVIRNKL